MDRLRFAPSPTGFLHVGGARTALLNWLYAKHYGGQFLLRVEDTDRARSTDESTRAIFEGLEWLGLEWDEPVVFQGANLARHQTDVEHLLKAGAAYRCFCTAAELDAAREEAAKRGETFRYDGKCGRLDFAESGRRAAIGEPFSIRFRVPPGETSWTDVVHGDITFPNKDIGEGDFIILRSDATPVYNMAVVSDDAAMGITLVMRGDDHISNTPKQILLFNALGAPLPRFAHLPMIHGLDGKKLSKRHGATAVGEYQHLGILPEAMLNFLALLGWNPGNDIEVMTVAQLIELFSVEGLSKKAAIFDTAKLEWMNGQHLALHSAAALAPLVRQALIVASAANEGRLDERGGAWLETLTDLLKIRSRTIDDIVRQAEPYLEPEALAYAPDVVDKPWKDGKATYEVLAKISASLGEVATWTQGDLEARLNALAEQEQVGRGKLFQPLRAALTGQTASPGIFEVLEILGRQTSLRRLDDARRYLVARDNLEV